MKKFVVIILSLVISFSVFGCTKNHDNSENTEEMHKEQEISETKGDMQYQD